MKNLVVEGVILCLEGEFEDLATDECLGRENDLDIKDAVLFDQSPEGQDVASNSKVKRLCSHQSI